MGINTENIYVGQVINNYKVFCELLGEPEKKGGKSKTLQLDNWARYFSYSRVEKSFAYIVNEIYAEPLPKIDGRKENNLVYGDLVEKLIIDLLIKNNGYIFKSFNYFALEIGMINENYTFCQNEIPKLAKYLEVDEYNVYEFYNIHRRNLRDIFESALKRLKDKRILDEYDKVDMIQVTDARIPTNELNTIKLRSKHDTFVKVENQTWHRRANEVEIQFVKDTKDNLLTEMGFESEYQVILSGRHPEFKRRLNDILFEKGNIDYMYKNYEVWLAKELPDDVTTLSNPEDIKIELNNLLWTNFMDNGIKRHKDIVAEVNFEGFGLAKTRIFSKKNMMRYDSNYSKINNRLISVLIRLDANNIRNQIRAM